jgi:quercetin dioxygenase-like cupin family protein
MLVQKEQLFVEFSHIAWEDVGAGVRRKVMAYGDQLMAVYVEFQPGAVGALHRHPHLQITYIQSGALTVHIGDRHQVLRGGDFYYIPADVEHGVDAIEESVLVDFFTPMRKEFVPTQPAGA